MSTKKAAEGKIGSVAPFGLRLLPELRQRLEEAAALTGDSLNREITRRLEASFENKISVPPDLWGRIDRAAARWGGTAQDRALDILAKAHPAPVSVEDVVRDIRDYAKVLKAGAVNDHSIALLLDDLHTLAVDIAEGKIAVKQSATADDIAESIRRYEAHGGAPGWEHMPVGEDDDE